MKKIKLIMTTVCIMMLFIVGQLESVYAASFSVSGPSRVSPGQSFTVSISASGGEGAFTVSATGGASVANASLWSGESTTVTAPASGTFRVTVTCKTFATNEGQEVNLGSKSLTVTVNTPAPTPTPTPTPKPPTGGTTSEETPRTPVQEEEETKSKDNSLSGLTVSEGVLTPEFNKDVMEYSVNIDAKTTKLTIGATATDTKATISGVGEVDVVVGENNFEVVVTAEDKSTRVYKVKVMVDETPTVFVEYNKEKLGIIKNLKDIVIPAGFEETTVKINDEEVKAWTNGNMNKTIVYMVNEKDERNFYLYDKEIVSIFKPIALLGRNVFIVDIAEDKQKVEDMKYQEVTVDGNKLMGWTFKDKAFENYSLISVMDEKGEMVKYQYESTENTMQLYDKSAPVTAKAFKEVQKYETYTMIVGGIAGVLAFVSLVLGILAVKYKKANARIVDLVSGDDEW